MRILMVGDVVGKAGRLAIADLTPKLKSRHRADFVIVNAENSAAGMGITREIGELMLRKHKVDVITLGNHAWAKRDSHTYLDSEPRILRPANYPPGVPGRGMGIFQTNVGPVAVIVVQCRVFMDAVDDPFRTAESLVEEARKVTKVVFVEMHGEATSEKSALGWHLDGKASVVVGTHTHVQTADERILPGGTAFLTDVGMTGPTESVIGMRLDTVMPRFLTHMPTRYEVADGPARLNAIIVEIDPATGKAIEISRIQESHVAEKNYSDEDTG